MKAPALFGRYQLEESIGSGGMAQVFRARSIGIEGFEKTVVIKCILPGLAREREFVEMFISEAKLAVSLTHPNIVQVFDLGKELDDEGQETIFIAMELVDGADLAELLKRRIERHRRAFPPALAAYIVAEVAKALDYAHRRRDAQGRPLGLVHRDVSPQNILISHEGDVKLTDFGIAKVRIARKHTEIGVLKGKYGYMSPEQVRGETIDGRSDIFALGVVFYELLSGRRLFRGNNPIETLSMIEEVQIPDPREAIPGLPEPFLPILKRTLTRYPDDRYLSAADLAGDLLALLFALGKPLQREELGAFVRDLLQREPKQEEPPKERQIDTSSLLEALKEKAPKSEPKETSQPQVRRQARPTVDVRGMAAKLSQLEEKSPPPRHKTILQEPLQLIPVVVLAAPPGMRGLLQTSSARARRIIARYRGRLGPARTRREQDALVAFFGDGPQDETAAERAARCALELVALSPKEDGPRAALVRSELPAKEVYRETAEYAANPAHLLAAKAGPHQILVDAEVSLALPASFPQRPLPDGEGAILDPEAARYIPPLSSEAIIGRRKEIRDLVHALAQAAKGEGQIAALTGPAGIGKTRLLGELRALLTQRHIGWFSGRCAPAVVPEPYHLIRDIFDHLAGCVEKTDPEEIRERLERLRVLKLGDRELDLVFRLHTYSHSFAAGELPGALPVLEILSRVVDEFTVAHPLVLVLEDLQWIDGFSRDVLSLFLERVSQKKLLVIATWRAQEAPGGEAGPLALSLLPPAEGELVFPPKTQAIFLPPLSQAEVEELAAGLLGVQGVERGLGALLARRSGGNPFFVMELLRSYLERDQLEIEGGEAFLSRSAEETQIPVTLSAILQERVKALSEEELQVLQAAAMMGQRFSAEEVAMSLGAEASETLRLLEQLSDKGVFQRGSEGELYFVDALLRDVLTERVGPEERRRRHERLARALQERFSQEKLPALAERAAHHYLQAEEPGRAAPLWEAAADASAKAGDLRGAFERYRLALEARRASKAPGAILLPLAVKASDALLARGDMTQGSKFLEDLIADLPTTDVGTLGVFTQLRGELALQAGDLEQARALLDKAATFSSKRPIGVHAARLPLSRGRAALFAGDPKKAIVHLAEAVALARAQHNPRLLGGALSALGRAHVYAGEPARAEECFEEAIALAREAKDTHTLCRALLRRAILPFMNHDFQEALKADREALMLAEAEGFASLAAHAAHYVGVDLVYLEDPGRAYSMLERSAVAANELGLFVLAWTNEAYLGYLDTLLYPDGPGLRRLLSAKEKLTTVRARPKIAQAYYLLGRVNLARKSRFLAKRHLQDALTLAEEIGHRFLVGEIHRLLEDLDMV